MDGRVITAEMPSTFETPDTLPFFDEELALLPRHDKEVAMSALGVSRATLHRYVAETRRVLTCSEVGGKLLFSDEDIAFLHQYQGAKSANMKQGLSDSQRERIAQLTAGVGRRADAEALRRSLRAQGEGLSMRRQVRLLLDAVPALRTMRVSHRVKWFYDTYYGTTDMCKWESAAAPEYSAVERAFRLVLKSA